MARSLNSSRSSRKQRTSVVIEATGFPRLIDSLVALGYEVLGPRLKDGAIVYEQLTSAEELPKGCRERQEGGRYRLETGQSEAWFGYATISQSWKQFLHPAVAKLWQIGKGDSQVVKPSRRRAKRAFLGVRPCDLQAITLQDRVLTGGSCGDAIYRGNRKNLLTVAVNCTEPGGTCFCASMDSGPAAREGFDLALTEVLVDGRHFFVMEIGSDAGAAVMEEVPHREAGPEDLDLARERLEQAVGKMGRTLDTSKIRQLLYRNTENPRWEDVASRCLTCANCTMVCPTCFCTTVEDATDLAGSSAERWRKWDSCFTSDFSYIHGGSIRASAKARYRQWLTHKLAGWIDQFESSGCVGCGRCITWCPVGIDITEEVRAIRHSDGATQTSK